MKSLVIALFILIWVTAAFAECILIQDIWHHKKGDISPQKFKHIQKSNILDLEYGELVVLQFASTVTDTNSLEYSISGSSDYETFREIGHGSSLQFPALKGGQYTLEIKSGTQCAPLRLPVSVRQTFWQEWWFWPSIVFYVLCLLGIASYFFFIYNLRQKLKVQEIRNRIAADLHDEVGSNLSAISIFVELLRKKSPVELNPILDKISVNSKETVQLIQDTIWAIQAKNDDFQKFIDKMKNFSTALLAAKNISLNFENKISGNKNSLTMDQRKNAYLIFKESINNIAKHAEASKVNIKIWNQGEFIHIEIMDNGKGFDINQNFEGNGLINFKERATACDINFSIESQINKGTRILISIEIE